jgi:hypothetical protein
MERDLQIEIWWEETMERRLNTRVEDYFSISYRVITREQYDTLERVYGTTPSKEWGVPELRMPRPDLAAAHDPLMAVITDLVKKVDRILEVLNHNRSSENASGQSYEKATCMDLSGSGMRLRGTRRLKTGELIEMFVPLPTTSAATVRLLATVVRDTESVGEVLDTAVSFSTINDEDREQIIAYVFQRERQILAANRALSKSEL